MATAKDLLVLARSYVGVTESPAGSNRQPFAKLAGHANGYAWCATFGVALQKQLKMSVVADSAYTPTCANMAKQAGRVVALKDAQPGDHAVVDFPGGRARIEHYVVLEEKISGNTWQTIEGNTSAYGSQTNGGAVLRKKRDLGAMVRTVVWRPYYDKTSVGSPAPVEELPNRPVGAILMKGDSGGLVVIWQQQLRDTGFAPQLKADGDFGPVTEAATIAFQAALSLPRSGMVGQGDIDAMENIYAGNKVPAQPAPELNFAVRFASGSVPDERMARAFAAFNAWHVASLDARQSVGTVYLVGGAAERGFDKGLAREIVVLSGNTRNETWGKVNDQIMDALGSL